MRNEKLEMRKWKWSSLLLVDDISIPEHRSEGSGKKIGC